MSKAPRSVFCIKTGLLRRFMSKLNINDGDEWCDINTLCGVKEHRTSRNTPLQNMDLDEDLIKHLVNQDGEGDTSLMLSIIQEHKPLALKLVKIVPDPSFLNITNDLFQTVLHLSVLNNNPHLVRELVIRGADLTVQDRDGNTPLHIACKKNSIPSIIALTTVITPTDREKCSYHVSTQIPQRQNIYNYKGQTCLHTALEHGHLNLIKFLLESLFRADINAVERRGGKTIFHIAAESGNFRLVKYLLTKEDLKLDQLTYGGFTALDLAKLTRRDKVVTLLERNGATFFRAFSENYGYTDEDENDNKLDDFEINSAIGSFVSSLFFPVEYREFDDICFNGERICWNVYSPIWFCE